MQLSKEEYGRKIIHNDSSVQIENSVTRVNVWHQSASLVMQNSNPRDGYFNQHLTTIKDSYIISGLLERLLQFRVSEIVCVFLSN